MKVRCLVIAEGDNNLLVEMIPVKVKCTRDQYANGEHLHAARKFAGEPDAKVLEVSKGTQKQFKWKKVVTVNIGPCNADCGQGVFRNEMCRYCGGNCPNEPEDSEHLCDGFAGDVDGLYSKEEMVQETVRFSAEFETTIRHRKGAAETEIQDLLSDIDIPENETCRYVGDTFEVIDKG